MVCLIYPGFWSDPSIWSLHIDWLVECEWLVWIIQTGIAFIFALFWKCLLNHRANISLEMGLIYLHKVCTHFFFPLEQVAAWCPSCCSVTAVHGWQKHTVQRGSFNWVWVYRLGCATGGQYTKGSGQRWQILPTYSLVSFFCPFPGTRVSVHQLGPSGGFSDHYADGA